MSREMQSLVDEDQVDQLLQDMDSVSKHQARGFQPHGPFLVFQADGASAPGVADGSLPLTISPGNPTSPGIHDILNPQTGDTLTIDPSLFTIDLSDHAPADVEDVTGPSEAHVAQIIAPSPFHLHIQPVPGHDIQTSVSTHAHFLLDHYKSQMGKLFSPLRARKSPWSILHFPRALSALAELSIFKTTKHAHTSLFYSVLAVSAFNWNNIHREHKDSTTYWRNIGEGFRRGAKKQLGWTCETELAGEKSSKYKDILMAILTMVTISVSSLATFPPKNPLVWTFLADESMLQVVTGQQEEARSYLLNAELFIGFRGAAKPNKSKRVKLLHSIYLFLRVIEESTYMYPLDKQLLTSTSLPVEGMRFPSLRTHSMCHGRDLDENIGMNFEFGLFGELDHPKAPVFFKDIYGFPLELLSFISRATFLANEIAVLRRQYPELSTTAELESRCSKLEAELCSWNDQGTSSDGEPEDPVLAFANRTIMDHLIAAFHCAAIIFFYRRVRQINPFLLQPLVEKTLSHLQEFEQEQRRFSLINCGIVWPGFIAGTEALGPGLQGRFYTYLHDCARLSGMRNFEYAADILRDIWSARREKGNENLTWMDLVRDRELSLILT